jgi:L-fuculose-phosphate aldolase
MTPREEQLRAEICEVGRRVYARGYVASNDGNISVRLDDTHLLATPKNVSKGFMTPDMMVVTDMEGRKVSGHRDASTEIKMHLAVYEMRPDIRAVVHAHPPLSTGFAVAGVPLNKSSLAEIIFSLGSVPIAEYATPSTQELPDAVKKYITAHDGLLLANHGALTAGQDLMNAYFKMETMEHFAQITLVARQLGGENLISRQEVERLQGLRDFYGIKSPAAICTDPALAGSDGVTCQFVDAPASDGPRIVPPAAVAPRGGEGGEIRLTYRELAALIADAVRQVTRDI